jgi:uncharacterized integral membrane protein
MSHDAGSQVAPPAEGKRSSRDENRLVVALVAAALLIAFAAVNTDKVKVNWIVTSRTSPLIVVIVVSALIGALADRFMVVRARRRRSS